tara:strand:- start:4536 stop:4886 length:351 start_codon:yes stop_codon:yes gene_type:complete
MTRLTLDNARKYLVNMYDVMNPKSNMKSSQAYKEKINKMNSIEVREKLEEISDGMFSLKGARTATNISYAPKETQDIYKEVEIKLGALDKFIGKGGFEYECGVYCKKVIKKKEESL